MCEISRHLSLPIVTAHSTWLIAHPSSYLFLCKPSTTNLETFCTNLFIIRIIGSDPCTSLQYLKLTGFLSREERRNDRALEHLRRNGRGWRELRHVSPIIRRHSRRTGRRKGQRCANSDEAFSDLNRIGSGKKSNISRIYNIFAFPKTLYIFYIRYFIHHPHGNLSYKTRIRNR